MQEIELLAPSGNFACLKAAINAGAKSVYFGVEDLNMRSNATSNFELRDLKEISLYCKENKAKAYLTLNTVLYDDDLKKMQKLCNEAKKAGIDAIIASDIAAIEYARSIGLNVHISTQLNVSNIEAVKFFAKYAEVIVLARELNLEQISSICKAIKDQRIKAPSGQDVRIEIFIHGALCVAISGKCYMSLAQYNLSANRGACLQACRRKYRVIEEETNKELVLDNKYIMSPKDLCTISVLDQIIASGVKVLKIEGRARPPEYVDTVVTAYREALQNIAEKTYTKEKIEEWIFKLSKVFNRGFWHGGYYLGNELGEWCGSYGSLAKEKKTYVGKATNYFSKIKVAEFLIQSGSLKVGDEVLIIGNNTGVIKTKIKNLRTDKEILSAQKGDLVAFPLDEKIKKNDQLYIIEKNL